MSLKCEKKPDFVLTLRSLTMVWKADKTMRSILIYLFQLGPSGEQSQGVSGGDNS